VKAVIATRPGGPEVLEVVDVPVTEPGRGEVRLRVHATAVNRADLLQREGRYPVPPGASHILGLEAAGRIDTVGPGVTGWQQGDRAMTLLSGGGYAEAVVVPAKHLMRVPDSLDWILAAAVPEAFLTAWQALGRPSRTPPGSWVLVHAAASGVGLAALQVARELGARTIATTRSPEKIATLESEADHAIVTDAGVFFDDVDRITAGHGADLIIDLVGARYWNENVRSTASDGRMALIGLVGGVRTEVYLGALMARRITVVASTLRSRSADQKAELVADFTEWANARLADRRLRPHVYDMLPLNRVIDAHRLVESNVTVGKVILAVTADGVVDR
jgi:tumor protein p53-inducible protein 3